MSSPLIATAQSIMDGPWRYAQRAREACQAGRWAEFVDATSPSAPWLLGRCDHAACRARAAAGFEAPRETTVRLVPVWVGDNPDETPINAWYRVHASATGDGPIGILESGHYLDDVVPALESAVLCRARMWRVANVVESRSYAPSIELALRRGEYGVQLGEVYEIIDAVTLPGEALPRPTIVVPPFCCWFEPRVSGLPAETLAAIRALAITTDSEGNLVPRPEG